MRVFVVSFVLLVYSVLLQMNDVGLQITPCVVQLYESALRWLRLVPSLCQQIVSNYAVSVLLSDELEYVNLHHTPTRQDTVDRVFDIA